MTKVLEEILEMSLAEKVFIVNAILESIGEKNQKQDTLEFHRRIIEERLKAHSVNPNETVSWEEIIAGLNDDV